jgi:hypothetical protein
MSPRWLHWPAPAAGGGTDYTDYMIAGTSYWIIPDGTSATSLVSGPTGGDSTATWTTLGRSSVTGTVATSQTGSVAMNSTYFYAVRGGFNQQSNPYQFLAYWCDGTGGFRFPQSPGWVIYEVEDPIGSVNGNLQYYIPIEVQSGVVGGTTTGSGYGPSNNSSGFDDSLVFFFNSYTSGDVQGWTAWDGTTTP